MNNFVIFKELSGEIYATNEMSFINLSDTDLTLLYMPNGEMCDHKLKKRIQPKEQVFFLRNIIKAIDSGFVDFADDKLYDFSFENQRAKDAGGVNSEFIDSDLKAEYKKELDFYYQKMSEFIEVKKNLPFSAFMQKLSDFFANVLSESQFNETPFELREKFYDYLTDKFTL